MSVMGGWDAHFSGMAAQQGRGTSNSQGRMPAETPGRCPQPKERQGKVSAMKRRAFGLWKLGNHDLQVELCAPLCGNTKGVPRWDGACFISNLDKDFNGLYYGDTSPMLGSWRKPWEAAPLSDRENMVKISGFGTR